MTKKNILCFGDSNTWGYDPVSRGRFPRDKRWTGILQALLGNFFYIIEEGLNGRTTVWDDPVEGHMGDKNGMRVLPILLSTHSPLDLVIVMLGTNDLKKRFSVTSFEASLGIERIIDTVKRHNYTPIDHNPEILILSPPNITFLCDAFRDHFRKTAPEESERFNEYYRQAALRQGCRYFDTAPFAEVSTEDGIHLTESAQAVFAKAVYDKVLEIIPD